jgi:hypothetical protein
MATVIGETYPYPLESAHRRRIEFEMSFLVGAAGAVGTITSDDPGVTVAHGSAGVYNLTFPAGADANGQLDGSPVSAAGTVTGFSINAFAPNLGTAQITCRASGGAATDPANGDRVMIQIFMNARREY